MHDLRRFDMLLREGAPLRFFVKLPAAGMADWVEARPIDGGPGLMVGREHVASDRVRAYVVSYPSGEVLDAWPGGEGLPAGVYEFERPVYRDDTPGYSRGLLDPRRVVIRQSASRMSPYREGYHTTSLTNRGDTAVRVIKFGFLVRRRFWLGWREHGRGYYSPRQFREWYRVPDKEGWVSPGETVADPDNWTRGRSMWVYFFEDRRGEVFAARTLVDQRNLRS